MLRTLKNLIFGHNQAASNALPSVPAYQPLLQSADTITLATRKEGFDPEEFFRDRPGLLFWNFLEKQPFGVISFLMSDITYQAYRLTRSVSGQEVLSALPADPFSRLGDIATLIRAQWGGQKGVLDLEATYHFLAKKPDGKVFRVEVHWDDYLLTPSEGDPTWVVAFYEIDDEEGLGDPEDDEYVVVPRLTQN